MQEIFNRKRLITIVCVFFLLITSQTKTFAQTYGGGSYGSSVYGGDAASPTPTPVPSSVGQQITGQQVTTQSTTPSPESCSDEKPANAPQLFQISVNSGAATLYFVPAKPPLTEYVVSFDDLARTVQYGATFQSSFVHGVQQLRIESLRPNTVYSFRIRAGNGCMPGDWSRTITARTTQKNQRQVRNYYAFSRIPQYQAELYRVDGVHVAAKYQKSIETVEKKPVVETPTPVATQVGIEESQSGENKPGFIQRAKTFFSKIFKKKT